MIKSSKKFSYESSMIDWKILIKEKIFWLVFSFFITWMCTHLEKSQIHVYKLTPLSWFYWHLSIVILGKTLSIAVASSFNCDLTAWNAKSRLSSVITKLLKNDLLLLRISLLHHLSTNKDIGILFATHISPLFLLSSPNSNSSACMFCIAIFNMCHGWENTLKYVNVINGDTKLNGTDIVKWILTFSSSTSSLWKVGSSIVTTFVSHFTVYMKLQKL